MAPGDPSLGQWSELFANWLKTSGFLTAKKRIPVQGSVTIDGKPLTWGAVTLIPEDSNVPVAWVHSNGQFSIDATHGPHRYSMDDAESYQTASPGAQMPLMVQIAENQKIQIAIVTK